MKKRTFYITTPIYYPSNKLHIGHTYTTVAADALARYHRLKGDETFFLTGTDEHGQKMEEAARIAGKSPIEFVDGIVEWIKELWSVLDISYDDFIRTTEPRHEQAVQGIFGKLYERGDIYKAEYEGLYCTQCEAFYTESQLKDGNLCPDHDTEVQKLKEESYFFRLSKYGDDLLRHIEANPDFIQPVSRRNEVVNFIKQGLEDLSVSRTSFKWGIPVPIDDKHVIYVWIDALANYITALGYPDGEKYKKYWPADVHLIGKDILRFHAIIWPIVLMALGEQLPKRVFGHGWVLLEGGKMSKAKGNVIDPFTLVEKYGVDPIRYFLLREVPFGADGVYSEEALILRTNVDLANDLGNLLSRTTAMIERFCDGRIPHPVARVDDKVLSSLSAEVALNVESSLERLEINQALNEIWRLINRANKYIEDTAPWDLYRNQEIDKLQTVLYNLAETIRVTGMLLTPFLVEAPGRIWQQLGIDEDLRELGWDKGITWGLLESGIETHRGDPLFPRIDYKVFAEGKSVLQKPEKDQPKEETLIDIEEFQKLDIRLAEIISVEKVKKADKLLKLQIRLGEEQRQIVAGIAQHYEPEELIGRKIAIIANLKPVKIRGELSQGMILAASDDNGLSVLSPDKDLVSGSKIK